ncbi:AAC(3) family N-acetyltransferase [Priestia megaterium]|jgi:aminoglycoside 3-N-acetyltransferase|uniref:aminoglycoside N(3)-acetyltransferase n=1 Tax=Priestia megaterium TaxID=1404 RepID=UPI002E23C54E|nr:AAC(3) family N-acetyltransferase [Priestia megaterium]
MKHIVQATDHPRTKDTLKEDLRRLGLTQGMTIMVHSSLSSLGWVNGGSVAVVQALMETVTEEGTIVMPSQSVDLSDPSKWGNPAVPKEWWETIRETMPAYDPVYTPTSRMGQIVETFRTYPGVRRSSHPMYSFAAWGKDSEDILRDHPLEFSLGENSPLERLYKKHAFVLLLGVGFGNNTSFHLAEYRIPYRNVIQKGSPVMDAGKRVWETYKELEFREELFEEIGQAFIETKGIKAEKIGSARAYFFSMPKAVDFAETYLKAL